MGCIRGLIYVDQGTPGRNKIHIEVYQDSLDDSRALNNASGPRRIHGYPV